MCPGLFILLLVIVNVVERRVLPVYTVRFLLLPLYEQNYTYNEHRYRYQRRPDENGQGITDWLDFSRKMNNGNESNAEPNPRPTMSPINNKFVLLAGATRRL